MSFEFETEKAPWEELDYIIDYSDVLAQYDPVDVVSVSTWLLDDQSSDDLTIGADSIEGTDQTMVRISAGGRYGIRHRLVNRITCASGQKHQRTIEVIMARK